VQALDHVGAKTSSSFVYEEKCRRSAGEVQGLHFSVSVEHVGSNKTQVDVFDNMRSGGEVQDKCRISAGLLSQF